MTPEKVWTVLADGSIRFLGYSSGRTVKPNGQIVHNMAKLAPGVKADMHFHVIIVAEDEISALQYIEAWKAAGSPEGTYEATNRA